MAVPSHILALYEPSDLGDEAVRRAANIASDAGATLTVVTVAVAERTDRKCCDLRSVYWNGVLRELAAEELDRAREAVGAGTPAEFRVVSGRSVPAAVADEARRCVADMVVVPRERTLLRWSRARRARQVRRRAAHATVLVAPE